MASVTDSYFVDENGRFSLIPNEENWERNKTFNTRNENISHFRPTTSVSTLNRWPQNGSMQHDTTTSLTKLQQQTSYPSFPNSHAKNISTFINRQMQLPNNTNSNTYNNTQQQFSREEQQRTFLQEKEQLRQRRIEERQKLQQKDVKRGPQAEFGGTSYLPAKPRGTMYRQTSEQSKWNASDVKQALLEWCRNRVAGYQNVRIDNFSSSWADGLAFCALVHHFFPQQFDFHVLSPLNRRYNFALAFDTAERMAGIHPILDVDDMVSMQVPDWKSVFTYIQSFYAVFGKANK